MCEIVDFEKMGNRINHTRIKKDLTIRQLSAKLGIEFGSLANIESGNAVPSTELLFSIADALDVPVDYLLVDSLDNTNTAVDYMIFDLFSSVSSSQQKRLVTIANALISVIGNNDSQV